MSGPTQGVAKSQGAGIFRKIIFGLLCIGCFAFFISLVSFKSSSEEAMSGELVAGAGENGIAVADNGSFLAGIFDHFGNVTFLFPLIAVFIAYKIAFSSATFNPKKIDFFVVGIFVLGLNLMVLGLCPLFDILSSDDSDGGGILGEFFQRYFFGSMPTPLNGLAPLALSLVGMMLFTAKGPLWYCDAIGSLIGKYILRHKDSSEEKELSESDEEVKESVSSDETQFSTGAVTTSIFATSASKKDDSSVSKREEDVKTEEKSAKSAISTFGRRDPSFGDLATTRIQPKFGQNTFGNRSSIAFGANAEPVPSKEQPRPSPSLSVFGKSHQKPSLAKRIEPDFGDLSSSAAAVEEPKAQKKDDGPIYISPGAPIRPVEHKEEKNTEVKNSESSDDSPKTFISGSSVFDSARNVHHDTAQKPQTTIIRDSRVHEQSVPYEPSAVQKTIITKSVSSHPQSGTSFVTPSASSAPAEPSTIVYKAGASHLDPVTSVGSPFRHSEVSTVITRTQQVPGEKPNVASSMKEGSISGHYSTGSDKADDRISPSGSAYDEPEAHSMFPTPEELEKEENVLVFGDFISQEKQRQEIKVDTLTSAFIPSDDLNRLNRNQSAPIKESDASFEVYSRSSRGVMPSGSDAPSFASSSVASAPQSQSGYIPSTQSKTEPSVNAASSDANVNIAARTPYVEPAGSYNAQNNAHSSSGQSLPPDYSEKVPFEDMSSINGSVPYGLRTEPKRNPITQMPTVSYARSTDTAPSKTFSAWRPDPVLLAKSPNQDFNNHDEIQNKIAIINKAMADFKINAGVVEHIEGPVITRYHMSLADGVRSSAVTSASVDLQRILMTDKININTSVPGTPYIGIDVPNDRRKMITLGDIVSCLDGSKAFLPMCLGVNTVGEPIVADLTETPHLLIAGTTGSGKSAGLNSMIVSMLLKCSPAELRLIMVDPKTVEFTQYQNLPHLLTPIITDPEATKAALSWLVSEQERRYKLIASLRARNIAQCNQIIRQANERGEVVYDPAWSADMGGEPPVLRPVPYIVLIIDEFADLMAMNAGSKKTEKSPEILISRLTAKARAAGIHLILATQTPRTDIVTGAIKANMPSRVAYTVQNGIESRIVLDEMGAENLLGKGDMIAKFQNLNKNASFRAHAPFASTDDVSAVVGAWIEMAGDPEYVEGVTDIEEEDLDIDVSSSGGSEGSHQLDGKFDAVVAYARDFCVRTGKALSISEIQSEFAVGYGRAKRIHKQMQQEGILDERGNLR